MVVFRGASEKQRNPFSCCAVHRVRTHRSVSPLVCVMFPIRSRSSGSVPPPLDRPHLTITPIRHPLQQQQQALPHTGAGTGTVRVKKEKHDQTVTPSKKQHHHPVPSSTTRSYGSSHHRTKPSPFPVVDNDAATAIANSDDDDDEEPQFEDSDPIFATQPDEYAMQWDITVDSSPPPLSGVPSPSAPSTAAGDLIGGGRRVECPVRGCHARYVNRKSMYKHMLAMHRGAKATKSLADQLPTTMTGRKKRRQSKNEMTEIEQQQQQQQHTTKRMASTQQTPTRNTDTNKSDPFFPRARETHNQSEFESSASGSDEDEDEDEDDATDDSSSDSDSSTGAPRPVAVPVRLPGDFRAAVAASTAASSSSAPPRATRINSPQKRRDAQSAASTAVTSSSSVAAAAAAPSVVPASSGLIPGAVYPPSNRAFPSWTLSAAYPAAARDGAHPMLQELNRAFDKYFTTPVLHRLDTFTVDELFAHYLLHLYSPTSGYDRLSFQKLLVHTLWIRGGLERWSRNWRRMSEKEIEKEESQIHTLLRRSKGTRDTKEDLKMKHAEKLVKESIQLDETDEATWWRLFTLSRRYEPTLLLTRISSFLKVTFQHGEGRQLEDEDQEMKRRMIKQMKSWCGQLPKPTRIIVQRPQRQGSIMIVRKEKETDTPAPAAQPTHSAATPNTSPTKSRPLALTSPVPSNHAQLSVASIRSSPSRSRASVGAGVGVPVASTSSDPSSDVTSLHSWSKSSLDQLNSLLLSNDGRVDRNLTYRQISDTLGGISIEAVKQRVQQIRKLKEIEETREANKRQNEIMEEKARRQIERVTARRERGGVKPTGVAPAAASSASASASSTLPSAMFMPPVSSNLLHPGDTSLLDSSLVPSIGNRGRKRKGGKHGPIYAHDLYARAMQTQAHTSNTKRPQTAPPPMTVTPTNPSARIRAPLSSREEESDSDSSDATPPPAKKIKRTTKNAKANSTPTTHAPSPPSLHHSPPPPPPQHHYAMMPYPGMHPGMHPGMPYGGYPYPIMPQMTPTPQHGANVAAVGGASGKSKSRSKQSPPVASPPPPAAYPPYGGYPPSGYPSPWQHAGPPGYPPPPPVGADGRPMQWSWMLVPVPTAAPHTHSDQGEEEE